MFGWRERTAKEAMAEAAVYIQNRGMTKVVKDMTPLEAWSWYKPSIKHFSVDGSICYFHIKKKTH